MGEIVFNMSNIDKSDLEIKELESLKSGSYFLKIIYNNLDYDFKKIIIMD